MNEQVIGLLSKKWVVPAAVGVASFGSGLVAGYIWGKRNGDVFEVNLDPPGESELPDPNQLELNFDEYAVRYIPEGVVLGQFLDTLSEFEEETSWELEEEAELMLEEDELEEAIAEQMHHDIVDLDEDNLPEVKNIFANQLDNDSWDYELELSTRTEDSPYVISIDEFVADEAGCEQSTVTYYQGDDIMADEYDVPIYGFNNMMGELKFGHGSNASDVVYIRNEKLRLEWEVILNTGRFDIEVLGHDVEDAYAKAELKHSVPRFRDE